MDYEKAISEQILVALRRIVRAIDIHSRRLAQDYGLTGPQVVLLKELVRTGGLHAAELAKNVSLSHATVTDILNRLEKRGLVSRTRSLTDRRRILVTATEQAVTMVQMSPPLLQERFSEQLAQLLDWELSQMLSVLQRVASMMDARELDASPSLAAVSASSDPKTIESVPRPEANQLPETERSSGEVATETRGNEPKAA